MNHSTIKAALMGTVLVCTAGTGLAQTNPQSTFGYGPTEYEASCAACHGLTGKGDGLYKPFLANSPTDLTTLAKRNEGVFPIERIYQIIDGRQEVLEHGTREMPIWGARYLDEAIGHHLNTSHEEEAYIRIRISWLIDYLNRLQVK